MQRLGLIHLTTMFNKHRWGNIVGSFDVDQSSSTGDVKGTQFLLIPGMRLDCTFVRRNIFIGVGYIYVITQGI